MPSAGTGSLLVPVLLVIWPPAVQQDLADALGGFPFFFWYQFLWVFLCSGFTYAAYVVVRQGPPAPADERRG